MDRLSPQIKGAITRKVNNAVQQYKNMLQQQQQQNRTLHGKNMYLHKQIKQLQQQISNMHRSTASSQTTETDALEQKCNELESKIICDKLPKNLINNLTKSLKEKCEIIIDQTKYKYVNHRSGIG